MDTELILAPFAIINTQRHTAQNRSGIFLSPKKPLSFKVFTGCRTQQIEFTVLDVNDSRVKHRLVNRAYLGCLAKLSGDCVNFRFHSQNRNSDSTIFNSVGKARVTLLKYHTC